MEINDVMIDNLASLSKLKFDKDAKEEIKKDLQKILKLVDKLQELNTENVAPLVYLTDEENVMREDVAIQEITKEDALKNAPAKDSDYFKAPKVIEK